jgi:AraC-like DNA-binding protein
MVSRKRIDWEVILPPGEFAPEWVQQAAPSDLISLLVTFDELFAIEDTDAMLRRAIELSLDPVGLVRAGIYLYDEPLDLMLGTWGTNLRREVVDEHHAMFEAGRDGHRVFDRAISGEAHWTLVEDCPIIDQSDNDTKIVGRGWVVCTPIRSARRPLGMLYNDGGLTSAEVDPAKQARAAVLCCVVGALLDATRHAERIARVLAVSAKHPIVVKMVRMFAKDPSLSAKDMSVEFGISLSRLARLFKTEMGLSLVEYRNRLRLDRFLVLVDAGGTNLLEAALAAGFGSYAQFHRVFCAVHRKTPREYLQARGPAKQRRQRD